MTATLAGAAAQAGHAHLLCTASLLPTWYPILFPSYFLQLLVRHHAVGESESTLLRHPAAGVVAGSQCC